MGPIPAHAQAAGDLAVTALNVPDPITVDSNNRIVVIIRNNGVTPVSGTTTVVAWDQALGEAGATTIFTGSIPLLGPGSSTSQAFDWTGYVGATPRPVNDPASIKVTVAPSQGVDAAPQDNVRRVTVEARRFGFLLSQRSVPTGTTIEAGGSPYDFVVNITSLAKVDDAARITVSGVTPDWSFVASRTRIELPRQSNASVFIVSVTAPADAPAQAQGQATITATSDTHPTSSASVALLSPPVSRAGTILVEPDPPARSVAAGADGLYTVRVRSLLNTDESIRLEIVPNQANGPVPTITTVQPISVMGGDVGVFEVRIPTTASTVAGNYTWRAHAFSPDRADVSDNATLTLEVLQRRQLRLELEPPVRTSVTPGTSNSVSFRLINEGNGPDLVQLSATSLPAGWTFVGEPNESLGPAQSRVVQRALGVPTNATVRSEIIAVRLRSTVDPLIEQQRSFAVSVPEWIQPQLEAAAPIQPIEPGQAHQFQVTLQNLGNTAGVLDIDVTATAASDPNATFAWSPHEATVAPGTQRTVLVNVTAPANLGLGKAIELVARVVSADQPQRTSQITLRLARPYPDLEVDGVPRVSPSPAYIGQPAEYVVRVSNNGTKDAGAFNLTFEFRNDAQLIGTKDVRLSFLNWSGAGRVREVRVPLPTNDTTVSAKVRLDVKNEIAELNETRRQTASSTFSLLTFKVHVEPPPEPKVRPGQSLSFEGATAFRIINLGAQTENLRIRITSAPNWTGPAPTTKSLNAGETMQVPVNLIVPETASVEEAVVRVSASHPQLNLSAENSVRLRLPDTDAPTIVSPAADRQQVTPGGIVNFTAQIHDRMGLRQAKLIIVSPTGEITKLPLTGQSGTYSVSQTFQAIGRHRIYFWAEDDSRARNARDTSAQSLTVRVYSLDSLELELESPAPGKPQRPGTAVLVGVVGNQTLASARYARGGITNNLTLTNPLRISTDGWTDGRHDLSVFAVGERGHNATLEIPLVIDGTAPTISAIDVGKDPLLPGLSVVVRATISDASALRSVVLRSRAGDEAASDLPMLFENGTYAASFKVPAGLESITIIAEDEAGNRGFGERGTAAIKPAEDRDGGRSPLGFSLAPLAVAVALLLSRRIRPRWNP